MPYIFGLISGTDGPNRFGPDPLATGRGNEAQAPQVSGGSANQVQAPHTFGDSAVVAGVGNTASGVNAPVQEAMASSHGRIDLTKHQKSGTRIDLEKR